MKLRALYVLFRSNINNATKIFNKKYKEHFGFHIQETTGYKVVEHLYKPKDASSLAVTRVLVGIAMLFDIPDERGGSIMTSRWGDPNTCHFPLIPFITAIAMPYMAFVFVGLWLGALGIALGYHYQYTSWIFTLCYWYLFLIEKSFWNNHSYLFGLVAILLSCTQANCYWSLDVYFHPSLKKNTVPYWNYFLLKYQFFILYFMAGMKKGTAEWLTGYSVQKLSEHWVFYPFHLFLSIPQIDYLIVHWFVFLFDLTIAFWMMWSKTRHLAMVFCALFHLMNSRLFKIGMFPWVCLATMPLFYPFDWPKRLLHWIGNSPSILYVSSKKAELIFKIKASVTYFKERLQFIKNIPDHDTRNPKCENDNKMRTGDVFSNEKEIHTDRDKQKINKDETDVPKEEVNQSKMLTLVLIALYVVLQAFLPYSHFITKGYNNWTNGLYGYSWDMMVHTWDVESVIVKVVDNDKNTEYYLDPYAYTPNDRWTRHGDMIYQYAHCLKDKLIKSQDKSLISNLSIYMDILCSMNGRFTQRMFDTKVDMLRVSWSPFQPISFLMPLLDEGLNWRGPIQRLSEAVHTWNNYSEVTFLAEFPDYEQEKFLPTELSNVTLTILEGTVAYEPEVRYASKEKSLVLKTGQNVKLISGKFHKIKNIASTPAFYMYTFSNTSDNNMPTPTLKKLPILKELSRRFDNMLIFIKIVVSNLLQLCNCKSN